MESQVQHTPMMQQYLDIKGQYQDFLLLYRMGDFYEFFMEDAIKASSILNIALTKRGKTDGTDIPMCGIPFHACEAYIKKLVEVGCKLAVCDQMETPEEAKKRGSKSVVRRDVVRIITPGTIVDDVLLDARKSNHLLTIVNHKGSLVVAAIDISCGSFYVQKTSFDALPIDLALFDPQEILISDKLYRDDNWRFLKNYKFLITTQVPSFFEASRARNNLQEFYGLKFLEALGNFDEPSLAAAGSALEYVKIVMRGKMPELPFPKMLDQANYLIVDEVTRQGLELHKGLYKLLDQTLTPFGARAFRSYFALGLKNPVQINTRLDNIEYFLQNPAICEELRKRLTGSPDFERSLFRLSMNRGGPRDLQAIREGLRRGAALAEIFALSSYNVMGADIQALYLDLALCDALIEVLDQALASELPMLARDGGFINYSYNSRLDEMRDLNININQKLANLAQNYRELTGVNSLKISHNNILGYFVDVTAGNSSKIPSDKFIHRQTMAGAVRYTTLDLQELEAQIVNSKDNILRLELELFADLVLQIIGFEEKIKKTIHAISWLDIYSSLAFIARSNNYVRPIVDDSQELQIEGGRHPVIECITRQNGENFTANDADLSAARTIVLTGPNMAGKSTYLRQVALIAYMAQIGCYVPASRAHIGVLDRIFSRIGANDDLSAGKSTFMVEMMETATILNQATNRSLIVLDEIGRGTATYDGLSIAYSALEYIHSEIGAKTMFATHYHEIGELASGLTGLQFYNMKVVESKDNIVFLHQVVPGKAMGSYGLYVAKLAGFPRKVLQRAALVLSGLEAAGVAKKMPTQLELFAPKPELKQDSELTRFMEELEVESVSPREALDLLYKLKEKV